jgi:small-conductance mechanosensitive channel
VLRSVAAVTIWTLAGLTALGEVGLNLGPLIAGAGILGIALGVGAQPLVKDFLTGIFMLVEDQYGVGDVIDVGEASGTVESISLRTTRLRGDDGTIWHVPHGEIHRVGNRSQATSVG